MRYITNLVAIGMTVKYGKQPMPGKIGVKRLPIQMEITEGSESLFILKMRIKSGFAPQEATIVAK